MLHKDNLLQERIKIVEKRSIISSHALYTTSTKLKQVFWQNIVISYVLSLFSAISVCRPPRVLSDHSHFWEPMAPKSGFCAPEARGQRKNLVSKKIDIVREFGIFLENWSHQNIFWTTFLNRPEIFMILLNTY